MQTSIAKWPMLLYLPPRNSLYLQCQHQTGDVACCRLFIFAWQDSAFCSDLLFTSAPPRPPPAHHSKRSAMHRYIVTFRPMPSKSDCMQSSDHIFYNRQTSPSSYLSRRVCAGESFEPIPQNVYNRKQRDARSNAHDCDILKTV